jgi:hypothetical protein
LVNILEAPKESVPVACDTDIPAALSGASCAFDMTNGAIESQFLRALKYRNLQMKYRNSKNRQGRG